ncbi:hypothetical protein N0V94_008354 [Neodidymelliopsis sp. IMI 364377]|nr:hypothetical protein N0V94_008354 [Neodidymelliopsis sp. IMI 364377]
MTASNTTTPMDIDRNTSPSIKSETPSSATKSDSTLPSSPPPYHKDHLPFLNTFASLPPTGSSKAAHILDLSALPASQQENDQEHAIKLQDAVATTLHLLSPSTLKQFLNPSIHIFKAVFKGANQLVIWRKGIEVLIGTFTHHPTLRAFGFSHVAGLLIGYDGCWHLKATAGTRSPA